MTTLSRWEIAGRALIAGCVTGGLLGAAVGISGGMAEDGMGGAAIGYGLLGVMCGIPVGVILCLPGMIVAVVLYPVVAERQGHAAARTAVAVIIGLVTGACLVLVGVGAFLVVIMPIAMLTTVLGLRLGMGSECACRGTAESMGRFMSMTVAVVAGLLVAVVVVAIVVAWMQSRGAGSFDPTFTRYPAEFMTLSPVALGMQAVPPSIPSAVVAAVSFGAAARGLGAGAAAGVAALGGSAIAVLMAWGLWDGTPEPSLTAALAGIGGVAAAVGAAGACALAPPLRSRLSG